MTSVARRWAVLAPLAGLLLLAAVFASSAYAAHYHTNCVGHGMVHGSSTYDDAFHARVEAGCGNPGSKVCRLYHPPVDYIGGASIPAGQNGTCNFFTGGGYNEETSYASVDFNTVFNSHVHQSH